MSQSIVDLDEQIYQDFLDEARDIINAIDVILENARSHAQDGNLLVTNLQREAFNLRMKGKSVDAPLLTVLAQRLADYAASCRELGEDAIAEVQFFCDKIRAVLEGELDPDKTDPAELVRELPSKRGPDVDPSWLAQQKVEALLVIPQRSLAAIVERELAACGYRSSVTSNAFEAFELAVRTRPDFIIAGKTLEGLDGVDLANALLSMPKTREIPFAILTGDAPGHPSLRDLPNRAAILRKGSGFGDDLAEALARFNIT